MDGKAPVADDQFPDRWLRRTLLGALIVLVLVGGYFVWRLARAVHRVERTATLAADKVEQLAGRVAVLEEKGAKAIGIDDLEATLDRMGTLRDDFQQPGSLDATAESEIAWLLRTIRESDARFESAGENDGPMQFYLKCLTKYQTYKRSLRTTEDFIAKLAGQSMAGDPYQVVFQDGTREPAAEWMETLLRQHRAGAATQMFVPQADVSSDASGVAD